MNIEYHQLSSWQGSVDSPKIPKKKKLKYSLFSIIKHILSGVKNRISPDKILIQGFQVVTNQLITNVDFDFCIGTLMYKNSKKCF